MIYPKEIVNELSALSKEVFGSRSRWKKLIEKGYIKQTTEDLDEIVPGENGAPDTTQKVPVAKRRKDGAYLNTLERHTIESVKEYMLDLKKKREEFMAMIKKAQEEQEAKKKQAELEEKVARELTGSSGG